MSTFLQYELIMRICILPHANSFQSKYRTSALNVEERGTLCHFSWEYPVMKDFMKKVAFCVTCTDYYDFTLVMFTWSYTVFPNVLRK